MISFAAFLACAAPSGPCIDRNGSYVVDFSERSGTCGPIDEAVVNIVPGQTQSSCSGSSQASTDNCAVDTNIRCPFNGGILAETGQVTWNVDGSSGDGTIQVQSLDSIGDVLCSGTYDVHYQRQ